MQLFPLPEPPADVVAELLENLRHARRELADASRIVHMLGLDPGLALDPRNERRLRIEQQTAERRCELWAGHVRAFETRARALGLDVTSTL